MPPVSLILRHGSTEFNDTGRYVSWLDIPLDENGKTQAQEAAQFLQQFPIKLIVCSPLARAHETAEIVGQALGLQPEVDSSLLPWNAGFMAGQPKAPLNEVRKHFIENPDQPVPKGEPYNEFVARFTEGLKKILHYAEQNGMVLIVAHSNNVAAAQSIVAGKHITPDDDHMVQPGGVLAIDVSGKGYKAVPIFKISNEEEVGTKASGFVTNGKQYCGDCIHLAGPGHPACVHPKVVADPELADRLIKIGDLKAIHVDLEEDCCRYINKGESDQGSKLAS